MSRREYEMKSMQRPEPPAVYMRPRIHDKTTALESLPSLVDQEPGFEQTKATGTDDVRALGDAIGRESRSAFAARGRPAAPTPVIAGQDSRRGGGDRDGPQAFDKATTCQRMSAGGHASRKHARQDSNL